MLTYRMTDQLEMIGYSDTDYAGCLNSRKSIIDYIFLLTGGEVSQRSTKQHTVTCSTMEAEYISYFEASSYALWLKKFISGFEFMDSISKPLKIYYDNSVADSFSNDSKMSNANKHIDIKYLVMNERISSHQVSIDFIDTACMIADLLTKSLIPKIFKEHVKVMDIYHWDI